MARTDNDSWDITDSVGATALGVAMARAGESDCDCPLFTDRYAQFFIDAAIDRGWEPSAVTARQRIFKGYAAVRTKWFDEYFIAAGANGIDQAVILAAGLDARAWRLPWVHGSVVYEIDQPQVFAFKAETLAARGARPTIRLSGRADRFAGAIGRQHCAKPGLIRRRRRRGLPKACCLTCRRPGRICCSSGSQKLSANGSRIAVEALSPSFFDPEYLERRRQYLKRETGRHKPCRTMPSCGSSRNAPTSRQWLTERRWEVTAIEAHEADATLRPAAG